MEENQFPKAIQFGKTTDNVQNIKQQDTTYHNSWPVNIDLCTVLHFEQNSTAITSGPYYASRAPGSVVGIATAYGLAGPGIESRWE